MGYPNLGELLLIPEEQVLHCKVFQRLALIHVLQIDAVIGGVEGDHSDVND